MIYMRKILVLIYFIFLCLPVFAWSDKAETESLEFLNKSVYSQVLVFKQSLRKDYTEIIRIINLYKRNPDFIKTQEIYNFGLACKERNQNLLKTYEEDYFKPAYIKYRNIDKSVSYDDWKDSVALSERSLFYDFYTFTESNLIDCEKIVNRSTSH